MMTSQIHQWLTAAKSGDASFAPFIGELSVAHEAACVEFVTQMGESATERLYATLTGAPTARARLLQALAHIATPTSCQLLTRLLVDDPPLPDFNTESTSATLEATRVDQQLSHILAIFFQRDDYDPQWLFPDLMQAISHPALAAGVLDLANFLCVEGRVEHHPARGRDESLRLLLGEVAQHLLRWEESPETEQSSARRLAREINAGVALAISLCHALGLMRCTAAIGKLHQASVLRHRRLRVAAATALARLGDAAGGDLLVELAAEPFVREAACEAARECGLEDRIPETLRSALAIAEARFVNHLAHPMRYGIPPTECRVIDQRSLRWPGYDEPLECYQFEFVYRFPQATYRNVGIAGPLEATLPVDLTDWSAMPRYALFAGWQAEHADMQQWDYDETPAEFQPFVVNPLRWLTQSPDYEQVQLRLVARFWEQFHLVATAVQPHLAAAERSGTVVIDQSGQASWYPRGNEDAPLDHDLAYACHKGRLLLDVFNV